MNDTKFKINTILIDYMHLPNTIKLTPKQKKEEDILKTLFTAKEIARKKVLKNEKMMCQFYNKMRNLGEGK
jgi:hypothetical protein